MYQPQITLFKPLLIAALLLSYFNVSALEFLPGIGVGLKYTNNAMLSTDNPVDDMVAVRYVGAKLTDTDGPLTADITAELNHQSYFKDSFEDRRFFNLGAIAGWEMIENRFDWLMSNYYRQRLINTSEPNTPDNIQDSNIFIFGANMVYPISARQTFTLLPEYRNFYYEKQLNDNQEYSLFAKWNYEVNIVSSTGLNAIVRTIKYDEPLIDDVTFTSVFFALSNTRARSNLTTNLGGTYVKRENGQSASEFAGNLNWLVDLTSHSRIRAFISTDLTDSNRGTLNVTVDPELGDPNDIQVTTDVIRIQVMSLGYYRQDGTLDSSITSALRQLNYSESPNDRRIWNVNAVFNYPVTALLSSGFNALYNNTDYIDVNRVDNNFRIGGNIRYILSRRLTGTLDLRYRNRGSTLENQNFDEWSVYASLTYGFGEPMRPF
jgi:hypothetical protein